MGYQCNQATNLFVFPSSDKFVEAGKGAGCDEENVCGVHLDGLTTQLTRALPVGHIDHRALEHLQHTLETKLQKNVFVIFSSFTKDIALFH